ncbi:hypothetical protein KA405_06690 [Patescibacteria group bacterium]|nr:hypothetical protein [Patescibacteria group bacterium]
MPLTKKIITNELKASGKEVITEADINNYIKEQINIDSVINEIFDNDLAMEQQYR